MQTCFGRRLSAEAKGQKTKWDCEKWLKETPSPECIPTLAGEPTEKPCRKRKRSATAQISGYYRGARGGIYFYAGGVVVYVPSDAKAYVEKNHQVMPASADPYKKRRK